MVDFLLSFKFNAEITQFWLLVLKVSSIFSENALIFSIVYLGSKKNRKSIELLKKCAQSTRFPTPNPSIFIWRLMFEQKFSNKLKKNQKISTCWCLSFFHFYKSISDFCHEWKFQLHQCSILRFQILNFEIKIQSLINLKSLVAS